MPRIILFIVTLAIPASVFAEEGYISRREGFLIIWNSIQRSAFEPRESVFRDIQKDDYGYTEITYATTRGIIDEAKKFDPDSPLNMEHALLWLFRSRNVREDLFLMGRDNIAGMLAECPIIEYKDDFSNLHITQSDVIKLARKLDSKLMEQVHLVSYYADDFHGNGTAFGETFDMHDITAAHRTLPHNTLVKVTNVDNRKSVTVRINDRGPYVDGRNMDLSLAAFREIAPLGQGVVSATFQRLGDNSYVDKCVQETRRFQKRITKQVRFHRGVPHTWTVGKQVSLGANKFFVVRGIKYPDGFFVRMQDFVGPKERFHFTPSKIGEYKIFVGTKEGRIREMRMIVGDCNN